MVASICGRWLLWCWGLGGWWAGGAVRRTRHTKNESRELLCAIYLTRARPREAEGRGVSRQPVTRAPPPSAAARSFTPQAGAATAHRHRAKETHILVTRGFTEYSIKLMLTRLYQRSISTLLRRSPRGSRSASSDRHRRRLRSGLYCGHRAPPFWPAHGRPPLGRFPHAVYVRWSHVLAISSVLHRRARSLAPLGLSVMKKSGVGGSTASNTKRDARAAVTRLSSAT